MMINDNLFITRIPRIVAFADCEGCVFFVEKSFKSLFL